jgi:hypothetical protein
VLGVKVRIASVGMTLGDWENSSGMDVGMNVAATVGSCVGTDDSKLLGLLDSKRVG